MLLFIYIKIFCSTYLLTQGISQVLYLIIFEQVIIKFLYVIRIDFFFLILRWSRANKPTLRQIHTKMSGNYFHRGISRLRAEELLLSAGEDGCFLVRDSETLQGAYVLCLL